MVAAKKNTFDIVPSHLVIKAMRDSGYKNAAYAIAELVDNAIQAGATVVEVVCKEEDELVNQRTRRRVKEIAVIDNGTGMNSETLRKALQFGNGARLDDRSGIGRFGMGLPNSSMSQAKRVDVWTWQKKPSSALHTYLALDEVESGDMAEVPRPEKKAIPKEWLRISSRLADSKSGTIVIWSDLDRCDWRTAHAIFRNSEYTIGRVYRRFLSQDKVQIRMCAFLAGQHEPHFDEYARPNDPLYLMEETSCPDPWGTVPMFEPYGNEHIIKWKHGRKEYPIRIRCTIAKKAARGGHNAGAEPHGKHAKNNIGVSIMRADRELELQTGWCIGYDPRERWWGIEVDFPPALDEVFGVTNNKQSARTLAEYAMTSVDQIAEREGYASEAELQDAWTNDADSRLVLLRVKRYIEENVTTMRQTMKAQHKTGKERRYADPDSAEMKGTKATQKRIAEGHKGVSDKDASLPDVEREKGIADTLKNEGVDAAEAHEKAQGVVSDGRKYEFYKADLTTPEFFSVRPKAGVILIGLNTNHPLYDHLVTLLEEDPEEVNIDALRGRLRQSFEGLKLLLEAWARYEDELTDGPRRERAQETRFQWGIVARQFFRED